AGVGTLVLVAAVARRYFGAGAGVVAAVLALLYAPLLFYELVLLRATLLAMVTAALVLAWQEAIERDRPGVWLMVGFVTGAAILLKSVFLSFAVVGAVYAAVVGLRRNGGSPPAGGTGRAAGAVSAAGTVAAGVLLGMLPLIARNVAVGAPPLALAAPGLANLIFGLGPGVNPLPGASTYDFASYGEILGRTDGGLFAAGVELLRMHGGPGPFLTMLAKKFITVWHWYEIPNNLNFHYFETRIGILQVLPLRFIVLAPLALVGMGLGWRASVRRWPLSLAVLTAVAVLTVFANNSRTRLPLVVALIPFAAYAITRMAGWVRTRQWWRAAAAVAVAAGLSLAMSGELPGSGERVRASDHALALQAYYLPEAAAAEAAGEPERAAELFREAVRQGPAWVRDPAGLSAPTSQERALAGLYVGIQSRCAVLLEGAGRSAEAATHRDLARRLQAALR
ncbi:MAG: hypothetical protein HKN12_11995, partial [Gemmatimonadetes bacterium]|nr:hypothetical protein [Gemmatimonadota bacterium]